MRASPRVPLPSTLPEFVGDHRCKGVDRFLSIITERTEQDCRATFRGEHHHSHDALGVNLEIIANDGGIATPATSAAADPMYCGPCRSTGFPSAAATLSPRERPIRSPHALRRKCPAL